MRQTGLKIAVLSLAMAGFSSAAAIVSENFEGGVTDGIVTTAGVIPNTIFSLVQGSVDLLGPTYYSGLCSAPASGNCLDTEGSTSANPALGKIQATSATSFAPGAYVLTFVLTGWSNPGTPTDNEIATVEVTLGGLIDQTYTVNGANDPYPLRSIPFIVGSTTSASLAFATLVNASSVGYAGAILDNVQINAVPEPGSLISVGLGLAILGLRPIRRRIFNR